MTRRVAVPLLIAAFLVSCQPAGHPNQISDFDGKTYDSLLLAHGALTALREQVRTNHRTFIPAFNQTAVAFDSAYEAYAIYRVSPQTGAVQASLLVGALASTIVGLERDITNALPARPEKVALIRARHTLRRDRLAASRPRYEMSLVDILSALQAGAQIAQTIPQASPYATLALLVIDVTRSAIGNSTASAGQPIDLSLIGPIALI